MRKLKPDEILERRRSRNAQSHPVMGILENVRSLHNVGSMFRTADAAGLRQLFLSGYTGTPENHRMKKTSLGSEETVPWRKFETALGAIDAARAEGYLVAVLEITSHPRPLSSLTLGDYPVCLIVGNEVKGVSEAAVTAADFAIELPQFGHKHSLNASVAFGIAAYDLVRQYHRLSSGSALDGWSVSA